MKKKVGRPLNTTIYDEPKNVAITIKITKKAKQWITTLGRGGLPKIIENLARKDV